MQDEYPRQFEDVIINDRSLEVFRLNVPGGWIVVTRQIGSDFPNTQFINDPIHSWELPPLDA